MSEVPKITITDAEAHWWLTLHRRQLVDKVRMLKLRSCRKRGRMGSAPLGPRGMKLLIDSIEELKQTEAELDALVTRSPEFKGKTYGHE